MLNSDTDLFIRKSEFRGRGWFGSRKKTDEMIAKLRDPEIQFIPVADLQAGTKIYIQDQVELNGETWYFILTEELGKLENSLFERWQVRNYSENQ